MQMNIFSILNNYHFFCIRKWMISTPHPRSIPTCSVPVPIRSRLPCCTRYISTASHTIQCLLFSFFCYVHFHTIISVLVQISFVLLRPIVASNLHQKHMNHFSLHIITMYVFLKYLHYNTLHYISFLIHFFLTPYLFTLLLSIELQYMPANTIFDTWSSMLIICKCGSVPTRVPNTVHLLIFIMCRLYFNRFRIAFLLGYHIVLYATIGAHHLYVNAILDVFVCLFCLTHPALSSNICLHSISNSTSDIWCVGCSDDVFCHASI
eukprot:751653_1